MFLFKFGTTEVPLIYAMLPAIITLILCIICIGIPAYLIRKSVKKRRYQRQYQLDLLEEQNRLLAEQNKILQHKED